MPHSERIVGRYEVLEEIGRGGHATVLLARHMDLGRLVALKRLRDGGHADRGLVERFLLEAQLAGARPHPNIVAIHDYIERDGDAYIAMELLPHGSLRRYIGHLSLAQVGGVLKGILAALTHVSDTLVHRDIKPDNILVCADGTVKLADFGIAKVLAVTASETPLTTGIIGSAEYMAPEQASGGELGPWTDLFSVGVVAYELLTGERPYPDALRAMAAMARLVNAPIRPPLQADPSLDPELAAWLERMLEKDPADRYRDPARAWRDLDEHLVARLGERWSDQAAIDVAPLPSEPPAPARRRPVDDTLPAPGQRKRGRRVSRLVAMTAGLAALAASLTAFAVMLTGR